MTDTTVGVLLSEEQIRSLTEARDILKRLAGLGVEVELLVDDLGEIASQYHRARRERMVEVVRL